MLVLHQSHWLLNLHPPKEIAPYRWLKGQDSPVLILAITNIDHAAAAADLNAGTAGAVARLMKRDLDAGTVTRAVSRLTELDLNAVASTTMT